MKRNSFLFASVVCFIVIGISGCNGTTQSAHDSSTTEKDSDSNTVAPEPDKRVNDSVKSADTVTQKAVLSNVVEQSTDCANGAKLENGKCVCADGSVWLGESWYCILNGQRCFAKECLINGDAYPQGTDFIYGSIVTERDSVRKYVCKNNVWSSRKLSDYDYHDYKSVPVGAYSFLYESNFYCGGIPVYSLGKDGEFTTCEMHDPECKSNAYRCSYHHWLCADEKGCQCFDGYETKNIKHDEVCENLICKNSMSESMVSDLYTSETQWMDIFNSRLRDFEHDERPGYCLDEQCPCGDGYCMRYGTCTDGICSCYNIQTNMHGEFYCNHYGVSYPFCDYAVLYCPDSCETDTGGILSCNREGGCHTSDGRHYPKGATIGFNGSQYSYDYNQEIAHDESLMFHIDAGFDTTVESISTLGECVLDRDDSIVRFSEAGHVAQNTFDYICDLKECKCGNNTCHIGEICRSGECINDTCKAVDSTKLICDVELKTGHRYFTPSECDIGDKCIDHKDVSYTFWDSPDIYTAHKTDFECEDIYDIDKPDRPSHGKKYYDVIECKGGHRYCHGKNNDPIRMPDQPEGWSCEDVSYLPGVEATDGLKAWVCNQKSCRCGDSDCMSPDACIDGKCVEMPKEDEIFGEHLARRCDDHAIGEHPSEKNYTALVGIMDGSKCEDDSCICGRSVCPRGAYCRNGRCLSRAKAPLVVPSGSNDYLMKARYANYYYNDDGEDYKEGYACNNPDGCRCNGEMINKNELCFTPCYGDGRLDENGCWCGDRKLADVQNETCLFTQNQYYVLCNDPDGCACGHTKCPMSSYCSEEQCIDPLNGQPVAKSAEKLALVTSCSEEQCSCGDIACKTGQFCYGMACHDQVYANVLHDQRYFYDERFISKTAGSEYDNGNDDDDFDDDYDGDYDGDYDENSENAENDKDVEKDEKNDGDGDSQKLHYWNQIDWNLIQSYDMSIYNPEHLPLDEYAFVPVFPASEDFDDMYDVDNDDCSDLSPEVKEYFVRTYNYTFVKNELRCMIDSGCQCGEHTCPFGAECIHGECSYNATYLSEILHLYTHDIRNKWPECGENTCPTGAKCIDDQCIFEELIPYCDKAFSKNRSKYVRDVFGKDSYLYCNGTFLLTEDLYHRESNNRFNDYSCSGEGWRCSNEAGCDCGDAKCSNDTYCTQPGICTR